MNNSCVDTRCSPRTSCPLRGPKPDASQSGTGHVSASIASAPAPMELYHMGYKFGGGPRNEARVPKFLPPSLGPQVFPELPASQVGTIAGRRSATARRVAHQALVASALFRVSCLRIRGGRARGYQNFDPRPSAPGFFLSCGKPGWHHRGEAQCNARRRVAHQGLVASALFRVSCLRIRGGRARGNQNFYPRPLSPGFFPSCRQARLAPSRGGAVQQLAACCVSSLVASALLRVTVCEFGEGGREAS